MHPLVWLVRQCWRDSGPQGQIWGCKAAPRCLQNGQEVPAIVFLPQRSSGLAHMLHPVVEQMLPTDHRLTVRNWPCYWVCKSSWIMEIAIASITQHVCKVLRLLYVHAGEVKKIYPSGWDDKTIVSVMNQGFIDHRKKKLWKNWTMHSTQHTQCVLLPLNWSTIYLKFTRALRLYAYTCS